MPNISAFLKIIDSDLEMKSKIDSKFILFFTKELILWLSTLRSKS